MQQNMQLLKNLQGLDQEINGIKASRKKLETEEAAIQAELARVREMAERLTTDLDQLQAERRELTQALALEQENVKKAEGRLPSIKTQKEYVAVLKEIDTAKKTNKEIQDRIQAKDRDIEGLERDRQEKQKELTALAEKVGSRQQEIDSQLSGYDARLAEQGGARESLLEQLPVTVRKRYQLLMDRRGGVAVVEARQGACQGCHMHLPPQLYNSLFRDQEIQSCPHCHRLLFVESSK